MRRKRRCRRVLEIIAALGVLLYAGVGVVTMFKGTFLAYNALDPRILRMGSTSVSCW